MMNSICVIHPIMPYVSKENAEPNVANPSIIIKTISPNDIPTMYLIIFMIIFFCHILVKPLMLSPAHP